MISVKFNVIPQTLIIKVIAHLHIGRSEHVNCFDYYYD